MLSKNIYHWMRMMSFLTEIINTERTALVIAAAQACLLHNKKYDPKQLTKHVKILSLPI